MLYSHILPYGCLFFLAANAQESSSSSDTLPVTNSELRTPTGSYISYASTLTRTTASSAISTKAVVSTISTGATTRTTTLGQTTLYGYRTIDLGGNSSTEDTASTPTQTFLRGSSRSTVSGNGTASSTSASVQPTNTTPCNNYAEFCSRKYGNITEVSTHNSPFVKAGSVAANQALDVITQLNDGIRMLQAQMHIVNGVPRFCHTSCDVLDAGPITTYLGKVKDWVASHPYDVVTIVIGNGNYSKIAEFTSFIEDTGIVQYAYEPPKIPMGINDWPTLESMIFAGKRVVMFLDYEARQETVPWLLDEFSQIWETPFDPVDRTFPCDVQRPPSLSEAETKNRMYITNHNLNYDINILGNSILVPNLPLLNVTNNVTGYGSLGVSTDACVAKWNYPPKFLNVDYYNEGSGSVFEVAAKHNNVTYNRQCCGKAASSFGSRNLEVAGRGALVTAFAVIVMMWMTL